MGRPDKNIYGPDLIRESENGKSNHNPVKTKPDPEMDNVPTNPISIDWTKIIKK